MAKLIPTEIKAALADLPKWAKKGAAITRTYEFEDFRQAMKFVDALAQRAEKAGHHPDIDIRWNKVLLSLTTHDAGGLTAKDFELAKQFDQLANT